MQLKNWAILLILEVSTLHYIKDIVLPKKYEKI